MNTSLSNIKLKLLLLVILLTPLYSIGELQALLLGYSISRSANVTPVYIKAIKDFLILLIIFLAYYRIIVNNKVYKSYSLISLIFVTLFAIILSLIEGNNYLLIIAGFRWFLPILLFFSVYDIVDEYLMLSLYKVLKILFFIHFIFQLIEFFFMNNYYGFGILGHSLRNPGIFLIPSTGAFFSMIFFLFSIMFEKRKNIKKIIIFILCPLSIVLTASGTGLISIFFCYIILWFFNSKNKYIIVFANLLVVTAFLTILPSISGRKDIYKSLTIRFTLLLDGVTNGIKLISDSFGRGTNTGVLMSNNLGISSGALIADSMILSILINIGWVGLILFVFFILKPIKFNLINMLYVTIFFPFIITTIMFEVFPSNIFFIVVSLYLLKKKEHD